MRVLLFAMLFLLMLYMKSAGAISQRLDALKKGEEDTTTIVDVSVMVYYTPAFMMYAEDTGPERLIKTQIEKANTILQESDIPVKLKLFCIEELDGFVEAEDGSKRLGDFMKVKLVPWASNVQKTIELLNTADIGKKTSDFAQLLCRSRRHANIR